MYISCKKKKKTLIKKKKNIKKYFQNKKKKKKKTNISIAILKKGKNFNISDRIQYALKMNLILMTLLPNTLVQEKQESLSQLCRSAEFEQMTVMYCLRHLKRNCVGRGWGIEICGVRGLVKDRFYQVSESDIFSLPRNWFPWQQLFPDTLFSK